MWPTGTVLCDYELSKIVHQERSQDEKILVCCFIYFI